MNILVTGGTGFAGRWLVERLRRNKRDRVIATRRDSRPAPAGSVKVDLADYRSVLALIRKTRPRIVYHLASLPNPSESFERPREYLSNNVLCAVNLLEALRAVYPSSKIILVGSSQQYLKEGKRLSEKSPVVPESPYALSKQVQEDTGMLYFKKYGLKVYFARAFNHYGPGQGDEYVIGTLCHQAAAYIEGRTQEVMLGNIEVARDFTFVEDTVGAYSAIAAKGTPGTVYNVCSGKPVRISELVDKINRIYKIKLPVKAGVRAVRKGEVDIVYGDVRRLRQETGWKPEVSLEEGLERTVEYWRTRVRRGTTGGRRTTEERDR